MAQGFAPNIRIAPRPNVGVRSPLPAHVPGTPAAGTLGRTVRGAAGSEGVQLTRPKLTGEDRAIEMAQGVQSNISKVWMFQMLALPLIPVLWVTNKFKLSRTSAALSIPTQVPTEMLNTASSSLLSVPGRALETASRISREAGAEKWANGLAGASDRMHSRSDALMGQLKRTAAPMSSSVGQRLDKVATTGLGKRAEGLLGRFANWRAQRNTNMVMSGLENAQGIFQAPDAINKAIAKATQDGIKPKDLEALKASLAEATATATIFEPVKTILEKATSAANPAARNEMLHAAEHEISRIVGQSGVSLGHVKIGHQLQQTVVGTRQAGLALQGHSEAAVRGLRGLTKNFAQTMGRTPIMTGLVVAATTAGVATIWMMRSKQSKEGKKALASLTQDMGGDVTHPLVAQASKIYKKQQGRTVGAAALSTTGVGVSMAMQMGFGLRGLLGDVTMTGGILLPRMVGGLIVPENPVLNAYASLQALERGEVKVEPAQHIFWVKQLIGNMPVATQKLPNGKDPGGVRNMFAGAMAETFVNEKANLKTIMATLADPQKFDAYALHVAQKNNAAAHDGAPTAEKTPATSLAAGSLPTPANNGHKPVDMPAAAEKPQLRIQAPTAANDGLIEARQKARA